MWTFECGDNSGIQTASGLSKWISLSKRKIAGRSLRGPRMKPGSPFDHLSRDKYMRIHRCLQDHHSIWVERVDRPIKEEDCRDNFGGDGRGQA